ncbi:MAG: hypothetical protein ACQEUZ_12305 [Pseudomonadota bacterium]
MSAYLAAKSSVWEEDDLPVTMNERILEAWRDMPTSVARLISESPSEGRLLFYVILSDVVFFLSWTLKTVLAPTSAVVARLPVEMGGWMLLAFLMRTAVMYVFAAGAYGALNLAGGTGSWRDTRAAVFWGALVSAPFGLLAAFVGVVLAHGERVLPALADPLFAVPPYYLGLVPFLWFIAAGLGTAHGFRRVGWIFLSLSIGTVALSWIGVYLAG